ncbi:delayed-early response protein/equilibrative nucleoside transporter [Stappia indica]|uniref:Nickel/cobalt efflux system n=2 Tax=Stappia indica TaxID=538381 RepID=A0A857C7R9_9HYPH|nr:delayed-early response protein/equilibrative nucleoside transporter [Stappia indica]
MRHPMIRPGLRLPSRLAVFLAFACLVVAVAMPALAAPSPFGVGLVEPSVAPGGIFSGFFGWMAQQQKAFYASLTTAIKAMKEDGSAGWWLMGLSFLYGVFHAAGPGHGKAVISSYVLANGETLRRGIALSFASAFAQAVTAVAVIGIASVLLRMTSIAITETTRWFEIGSYAAVALLGAYLVWRKILKPMLTPRRPVALGAQAVAACTHDHSDDHDHHHHDHGHGHGHVHHHHDHDHAHHHDHAHEAGEVCGSCGHVHAPPPSMLTGEFSLTRAWSVILAIGLRPCTGALVVLVFAISQGLALAGVAATFAMAVGTGLTVSVLAVLAVVAKDVALRSVGGRAAARLHAGIEGFAALVVFLLGTSLLVAALGWGGAV